MRAISLAEINAKNRAFWQVTCARQDTLLRRRYIRHFVKVRFCEPTGPSYCTSPTASYWEPSFYAELCLQEDGFSIRQRAIASEPRRKAVGSGLSRRQIVMSFASSAERSCCRTKSLWNPFYAHLDSLDLNPTVTSDSSYAYDGKRGRIAITYRQFEKLVSDLAPRRKKK